MKNAFSDIISGEEKNWIKKYNNEKLTPSASSIISRPIVANVVHLQFAIAFAAHRLCTLHLHTSHESP